MGPSQSGAVELPTSISYIVAEHVQGCALRRGIAGRSTHQNGRVAEIHNAAYAKGSPEKPNRSGCIDQLSLVVRLNNRYVRQCARQDDQTTEALTRTPRNQVQDIQNTHFCVDYTLST
jgi:hypothetical protein